MGCCIKFAHEVHMNHIGFNGWHWGILGCCKGCYTIFPILFCPFCGTALKPLRKPSSSIAREALTNQPTFADLEPEFLNERVKN